MFRGIDPEGLAGLATSVEHAASEVRHRTGGALEMLARHGRTAEAASISEQIGSVANWGSDTSTVLRWRASAIETGQQAGLNLIAIACAQFAAQAVFTAETVEETYQNWVVSNARVADAVTNISAWLDQGWTDWDVTNNDLHNIRDTLTGLSPGELDRVIAGLSPAQLRRWVEEMGNGINGFSRSEKQDVFELLATSANGASLVKIHEAILHGGTREEAIDLGRAIQVHSADAAIVRFVENTLSRGLTNHQYSAVSPGLAIAGIDDESGIDTITRAILDTDGAVELLFIDSLVTAHIADDGNSCVDIDPFASLIDGMRRGTDPKLKAGLFSAISQLASGARLRELLRDRHGIADETTTDLLGSTRTERPATDLLDHARLETLEQATRLLLADIDGVVEHLATDVDTEATATIAYLHALVDTDRVDLLSNVINTLHGGATVNAERFSDHGSNPEYPYPHAQNLGFLAGSLRAAMEVSADDAKDQIEMIVRGAAVANAIVGFFWTFAHRATEAVSGVVGLGIDQAGVSQVAATTVDDIDDQFADLVEVIETNLQPQRSVTPGPPHMGDAMWAWDERYDLVLGR